MKIETKLDIGDTAFFMTQSKVYSSEIESIDVHVTQSGIYKTGNVSTKYWVKINPAGAQYTTCFYDNEIFASKELLLETL